MQHIDDSENISGPEAFKFAQCDSATPMVRSENSRYSTSMPVVSKGRMLLESSEPHTRMLNANKAN